MEVCFEYTTVQVLKVVQGSGKIMIDYGCRGRQKLKVYITESTTGDDASVEAVPKAIRHEVTRSSYSVQNVGNDRPWSLLAKVHKSIKLMAAAWNS